MGRVRAQCPRLVALTLPPPTSTLLHKQPRKQDPVGTVLHVTVTRKGSCIPRYHGLSYVALEVRGGLGDRGWQGLGWTRAPRLKKEDAACCSGSC